MTKAKQQQKRKAKRKRRAPRGWKYVRDMLLPSGVWVHVVAKQKIGRPRPWPYDETPRIRFELERAFERRGFGQATVGYGIDGVIETGFEFFTKDEKQAREILAELFSEIAYGWTFRAEVTDEVM